MIAFRAADFAVFLFGFGAAWLAADAKTIGQALEQGGTRGGAAMTKETKEAFDARFAREMSETAEGVRKLGLRNDATHKLTLRELNRAAAEETVVPLTGVEIKGLRERAKLSQAVFARYLHLTPDHVSKWERDEKRPTGPALVLLNVIRRKGIEAIL